MPEQAQLYKWEDEVGSAGKRVSVYTHRVGEGGVLSAPKLLPHAWNQESALKME